MSTAVHFMSYKCLMQLASAVVKLSKAALSQLDLRQHTATHPRLGVVDHIVCNPLGPIAELSSAAKAAQRIGEHQQRRLGQPNLDAPALYAAFTSKLTVL